MTRDDAPFAPRGLWPAALVLLAAAALAAFGEHIPLYNGFGWDGSFYAWMVSAPGDAFRQGINAYHLQRTAPALGIHAALRLAGADLSDHAVVRLGFQALNCTCLGLAAVVWARTSRALRLGAPAFWLGAVGLFVNYAALKMAAYYPSLNDVPALLLGVVAVWAFVTGRGWALAAVGVVGAFTWPVAAPAVALLLAAPRRPVLDAAAATDATGEAPARWSPLAALAAVGVAAALAAEFASLVYVHGRTTVGMGPTANVYLPLAPLSIALSAALCGGAIYALLRPFTAATIVRELRAVRWWRVAAAAVVVVGPALVARALATGKPALTAAEFWSVLAVLGATRPLASPVAHVAYFGPALLLLVPLWRDFVRAVHAWGPGATAAVLLAVVVAIGPESRQSMFTWPLVLAPLCVAADRRGVPGRVVGAAGALALVLTKVWLPHNTHPVAAMRDPGDATRVVYGAYFDNQGPYMSAAAYAAHAAAAVAAAGLLALAWRWSPRARLGGAPRAEAAQPVRR
jgi:hypothetical protein